MRGPARGGRPGRRRRGVRRRRRDRLRGPGAGCPRPTAGPRRAGWRADRVFAYGATAGLIGDRIFGDPRRG
ncbi:hypothetical protein ACWDA9_42325, partial [Streptomyces sp. NPDC001193]